MFKRTIGIVVIMLCLCLCILPCYAQAASDSNATRLAIHDKECTLTISYRYGDIAFSDLQVNLYRIADVSTERYTLTDPFKATNLLLNRIETSKEWDTVRSTLESYIVSKEIAADDVLITDQDGTVCFGPLKTGIYLAVVDDVIKDEIRYRFESALLVLPGLGQDGSRLYEVSVNSKSEIVPPVKDIEYKVVKLWKGDSGRTDRPESVEVDIICDQVKYETVTLSKENNWSYSWIAKEDGSRWIVAERNVPQGYTVTVEEKGTSFILTNTRIPSNPGTPEKPPQTGDTANILPYILIMTISGLALIVVGFIGKRKADEDK